ncbi:hypothetical protein PYCC9005_000040 [Savitreella phatthalungensis]
MPVPSRHLIRMMATRRPIPEHQSAMQPSRPTPSHAEGAESHDTDTFGESPSGRETRQYNKRGENSAASAKPTRAGEASNSELQPKTTSEFADERARDPENDYSNKSGL